MTKVMVTGSRSFGDVIGMHETLSTVPLLLDCHTRSVTVIHGGARGADAIANAQALELGMRTHVVEPRWSVHTQACPDWHDGLATCRMAGHRRNDEMLSLQPRLVLGFPAHLRTIALAGGKDVSRGTWATIDKAVAAHLPTMVYWRDHLWPANPAAATMITDRLAAIGEKPLNRGQAPVAKLAIPF